ncbi:MAG: hypothetical protein AAF467_15350 [Actinomycetota bacterium]
MEPSPAVEAFESSAAVHLGTRDVLVVSGPDAAEYLQGQISQDVNGLSLGESRATLVLQPQGKVDAYMRITKVADATYWLDVDAGWGEVAQARLERFKLRVDCTIEQQAMPALSVRGAGSGAGAGPDVLGIDVPPDAVVAAAPWPTHPGYDVLGWSGEAPVSLPVATDDEFDGLRIRNGVPRMGAELDDATIPAAAGVVDASVDFTKGCYVGQELVARVDSRGSNTPTRLWGITMAAGVAVAPGDALVSDGAEVGTVTSVAGTSAVGPVALAYLKRSAPAPGPLAIAGSEAAVEAVSLPIG